MAKRVEQAKLLAFAFEKTVLAFKNKQWFVDEEKKC